MEQLPRNRRKYVIVDKRINEFKRFVEDCDTKSLIDLIDIQKSLNDKITLLRENMFEEMREAYKLMNKEDKQRRRECLPSRGMFVSFEGRYEDLGMVRITRFTKHFINIGTLRIPINEIIVKSYCIAVDGDME